MSAVLLHFGNVFENKNGCQSMLNTIRDTMSDMTDTMGSRIRKAMEDAGYSYRTLAPKIHVSPGTLHSWVKKEMNVDDAKLELIAKFTNTTAVWLRYGDQPVPFSEELLIEVVTVVTRITQDSGLKLSPDKFGRLIGLFYSMASKSGSVDRDMIRRMIEAASLE